MTNSEAPATTRAGVNEDAAWDRYRAQGNLHSFSQVAPGNYGGAILLLALEVAETAGRAIVSDAADRAAIEQRLQAMHAAARDEHAIRTW